MRSIKINLKRKKKKNLFRERKNYFIDVINKTNTKFNQLTKYILIIQKWRNCHCFRFTSRKEEKTKTTKIKWKLFPQKINVHRQFGCTQIFLNRIVNHSVNNSLNLSHYRFRNRVQPPCDCAFFFLFIGQS